MAGVHDGPYVGLLSFMSFAFSVMAAVLAIDMYALLRTGEFGKTWRVLIIATVIFALMQALKLAEILNFQMFRRYHLSEVVELMFVIALMYTFWSQRKLFSSVARSRRDPDVPRRRAEDLAGEEFAAREADPRDEEWSHLAGHYSEGAPASEGDAVEDDADEPIANGTASSPRPLI